jgi:hypothetical protein
VSLSPTAAPPTAPPTTAGPVSPTLTAAEIALSDQLDPTALTDCQPNPALENINVSASLTCEADDGRRIVAMRYRSLTAHNSDVFARSRGVPDNGDCTDGVTSVETWHYNSAPNVSVGALVCSNQNGNFEIFWTYRNKLLGFLAQDPDPTTIAEFWKSFEAVQR